MMLFHHRGSQGDVIHAIPTIIASGGGDPCRPWLHNVGREQPTAMISNPWNEGGSEFHAIVRKDVYRVRGRRGRPVARARRRAACCTRVPGSPFR